MSDTLETYKVVASLLGGGAVGAIITAVVASYRNRVQPVGKRLEVTPVFTSPTAGSTLNPTISVSDGGVDHRLRNLFVADLQVVNRGNRDMASFSFGITLAAGDEAIHVESYGLDRHHVAHVTTPVSPGRKAGSVDLVLEPFNRGDSYPLKIMIVASGEEPGLIGIGSSEPVRFTEMPTLAETMTAIATTYSLRIGGFELRIPR